MVDKRFFQNHGPFRLSDMVEWTGAELIAPDASQSFADVAPLDRATAEDISFFDNAKYLEQFAQSKAGACFVRAKFKNKAPAGMVLLITEDPYRAYAMVAQYFYPFVPPKADISEHAFIHPEATLGKDVIIDAGAVISAHAEIGDGAIIGANAVIQEGVIIGEHTRIGATSTISHAIIGAHTIIHRGVHIGQDGFGFSMGKDGHVKVPQLGRVVIGNHVEIGAGTCIDRGTGPDTTIGDGCKIDNLVQLGHNVQIGNHAIIVSQSGVSGSTRVGDFTIIAGQVGIAGHLKIGPGARIAAKSGISADVPAGASVGGIPAVPIKDWHRQVIALNRLIKAKKRTSDEH